MNCNTDVLAITYLCFEERLLQLRLELECRLLTSLPAINVIQTQKVVTSELEMCWSILTLLPEVNNSSLLLPVEIKCMGMGLGLG